MNVDAGGRNKNNYAGTNKMNKSPKAMQCKCVQRKPNRINAFFSNPKPYMGGNRGDRGDPTAP